MSILPKKTNQQHFSGNLKKRFLAKFYILPVCILFLCSAILLANYYYPLMTYATPTNQISTVSGQINTDNKDAQASTPSIWPANGQVTSGFGWRNSPFEDGNELHAGIDIAAYLGEPVVATADGQVVYSGWNGGYGNMVEIHHANGIDTIYGHNSQLAVSVGQKVQKGQVISYAGSTGKSTGPHVHYEVRKDGTAIDPWKYLISY